MIKIIIIAIGIAFLITFAAIWTLDSYTTYKRLNRIADKLIADTEMNIDEKCENLSWYCLNAIKMGDISYPLFKNKFYDLHTKLFKARHKIDK